MNVEIGAEAALFPEKEYISVIFVAVHTPCFSWDSASGVQCLGEGLKEIDLVWRIVKKK